MMGVEDSQPLQGPTWPVPDVDVMSCDIMKQVWGRYKLFAVLNRSLKGDSEDVCSQQKDIL